MGDGSLPQGMSRESRSSDDRYGGMRGIAARRAGSPPAESDMLSDLQKEMPDVDLGNRHPALQSMCSKD